MLKFFKEPLFHFLLFGILIFVLYAFVNQSESAETDIVIDDAKIEHVLALFRLENKREPSNIELVKLIDENIKQEIFYREALRLHLDENDDVVKSRLAQKMEFLNTDLASINFKPSHTEIKAFYNNNRENYKTKARFSFYQITFSPKNHDSIRVAAERVLENANRISIEEMRLKGDQLTLSFAYNDLTPEAIGYELDKAFAEKLKELPLNQWVGPVKSKHGEHLVYITEWQESGYPSIESIESKLINDYAAEKEREVKLAMYKELKSQYKIQLLSSKVNAEMKEEILELAH